MHNTQNMVTPWSYRCRKLSVCSCCFLFSLPFLLWAVPGAALVFPKDSPEWGNLSTSPFHCFVHLEITLGMAGHNSMYLMDSSHPSRKGWTHPQWPAGISQGCPGAGESISVLGPGWEKPKQEKSSQEMLEWVNSWIPPSRGVLWCCSNSPAPALLSWNTEVLLLEMSMPWKWPLHHNLSCYLMAGKTLFESFFGNLNTQI